jgi:hypothetical protein
LKHGNVYGYGDRIDEIIEEDMKRLRGHAYLDNTGSGMYRESQLRSVFDDLSQHLYGMLLV